MTVPVYVKIDKYKKVSAVMERIREKLEDAKVTLKRLNELKSLEEEELKAWEEEIGRIEQKIGYIENLMPTKK